MNRNAAAVVFGAIVSLSGVSAHAEGVPAARAEVNSAAPAANVPADNYGNRNLPADNSGNRNVPADNSGKNVRDRADAALTPGDQSNAPADVEITAEVRRAIVADPNLSMNADNVKIITAGGVVTLRGPVKNAAEKANVAAKAQKVAGVTRVDNQIEIAGE